MKRRIKDEDFLELLGKIIDSFNSDKTRDLQNKKGMPIGNLTSQYFANIYLDDFDKFVKQTLKVKYYIRYADDFIILHEDKEYLESLVSPVNEFLKEKLDLEIHQNKVVFRKFRSGVDFLGYIIFPYFILPRTRTKRRALRKIKEKVRDYKEGKITREQLNSTIQSYLGYLGHANTYKFRQNLKNLIWVWLTE